MTWRILKSPRKPPVWGRVDLGDCGGQVQGTAKKKGTKPGSSGVPARLICELLDGVSGAESVWIGFAPPEEAGTVTDLLKRQIFGRAELQLLRKQVLFASYSGQCQVRHGHTIRV
jgi:hypothetical protein